MVFRFLLLSEVMLIKLMKCHGKVSFTKFAKNSFYVIEVKANLLHLRILECFSSVLKHKVIFLFLVSMTTNEILSRALCRDKPCFW